MAAKQSYSTTAILLLIIASVAASTGLKEVCQWETFEAKCLEDEVIMIKEAHYGRMGVGRCQPRDFGFAGCSADVSAIMHARCSGRRHCSVQVPDADMFAASPCPKDLVSYLQADYECVKVAKHATDNCDDQILTAVSGDIAKPLTNTKDTVCPQRILAQPGQTVNVYLYDFYNKDSKTETTPECISYGSISERTNTQTKICGGKFRKNHLIYSSDTNLVDITLTDESSHSHHYVLHYKVLGCPTPHSPPDAWVKIEDNTAIVMCNFTHIASKLVCSGHEWVGEMHNCTDVEHQMAHSLAMTSLKDIVVQSSKTMFVFLCIGLACCTFFAIGLLAIIKARRIKNKQISDLPRTLPLNEKPVLPQYESSVNPINQYEPVYVPITTKGQQIPAVADHIYDTSLPTFSAPLSPMVQCDSSLVSNGTNSQNIYGYGPLRATKHMPASTYNHHLSDLVALGHTLGREKVITIDEANLF